MRLDLKKWWNNIYDQWLNEGDILLLMYLQKIERYLGKGSIKSDQETINLIAQIEGLMSLKYNGSYRLLETKQHDISVIASIMNGQHVILPNNDLKSLAVFFQNKLNQRIKPQNSDFSTHPCWILWSSLYDPNYRQELWGYRKMFIYYMNNQDFLKAAKVFKYACSMKIRNNSLPLLHPHIVKTVMYANIKNNINL